MLPPCSLPSPPSREGEGEGEEKEEDEKKRPALKLELGGYADLQFAYYNHWENQNREGAPRQDSRLTFDTTRLVLELEAAARVRARGRDGGGVRARRHRPATELEYEEFGEFEQEVEKGGEVLVEEIYLKKEFAERFGCRPGASTWRWAR